MPKNKPREEKKPIGERISALLARTIRFVTYDIWRITENEVSGLKEIYINIIKTVILAVRVSRARTCKPRRRRLPTAPCYLSYLCWPYY